jgi:hypothetical protein
MAGMAGLLDGAGADARVWFDPFYQPDLDRRAASGRRGFAAGAGAQQTGVVSQYLEALVHDELVRG